MTRAESASEAERQALSRMMARLEQQFPELSTEEIERAVHGEYAKFDHAPIRDFVPIFVERRSRKNLRSYRA